MARPDAFWFADGSHADSIEDLLHILEHGDEALFRKHLAPDRNDFANWVRNVFGEDALADHLDHSHTVYQVRLALEEHLRPRLPPPARKAERVVHPEAQRPVQPVSEPPEEREEVREEPPQTAEPVAEEVVIQPSPQPAHLAQTPHAAPQPHHEHFFHHTDASLKEFVVGFSIGFVLGIVAYQVIVSFL